LELKLLCVGSVPRVTQFLEPAKAPAGFVFFFTVGFTALPLDHNFATYSVFTLPLNSFDNVRLYVLSFTLASPNFFLPTLGPILVYLDPVSSSS